MFSGPLALLARALRIDARSQPTHLFRFAMIGLAYFYFLGVWGASFSLSAPGLYYFSVLAFLDIFFIALFGIGYFSSTISEEKEEGTLGLLMMAGIDPIGILAGKMGARFCQVASLLLIQFPLMLLCITLGGVSAGQIWAATMSLMAFLCFVAGFGLFSSTIARNSREAGGFVAVGLVLYFLGIPLLAKYIESAPSSFIVSSHSIYRLSIIVRLMEILGSGFSGSVWCPQLAFDGGLGVLFGVLAWLVFGIAARNLSSETHTPQPVSRGRGRFRFPVSRAWDNAIAWKDFYFVSGGIPAIIFRTVIYLGAGIVIGVMSSPQWSPDIHNILYSYLIVCTLIWPLDLAISWSQSMEQEVRLQTISSLAVLPCDIKKIVHSKLAGSALGSLPGLIVIVLVGLVTLLISPPPNDIVQVAEFVFGLVVYILLAMLFPVYAAMLALYLRWGSVAVTIGLMFFTCSILLTCLDAAGPASSAGRAVLLFWIGGVVAIIHFLCYDSLLFRFRELIQK